MIASFRVSLFQAIETLFSSPGQFASVSQNEKHTSKSSQQLHLLRTQIAVIRPPGICIHAGRLHQPVI